MQLGPEEAAHVRVGEVLGGKYRVERLLGAGGMGVVVAAHHLQLDERVALKFLLPAALGNADAIARFAREARAAVKIKSEHVARVIDANLFVVRRADGLHSIKVLDFGISKLTALGALGPDMAATKTSTIMGSPFYMSPEQLMSSRDVGVQADVWALGVILYEALSGKTPFFGDTFPEVCMKIATDAPPPLRSVRPDAPAGLEAAIGKCLEKDRGKRYANVAELALALLEFAPKRAHTSVERISRIIETAGLTPTMVQGALSADPWITPQPTQTIAPLGRTTEGPINRKKKVAALVIGVACALGTAVSIRFVVTRKNVPPPELGAARSAATRSEESSPAPPTSPRPWATASAVPAPPTVSSEPAPTNLALQSESSPRAPPPPKAPVHASAPLRTSPATAASDRTVASPSTSSPATALAPARAAPTANCDPPYYFDAKGTRVFKKECL